MSLRVVIVKMRRGIRGKINKNSKPYTYICPIPDINKGDYVVVEVTRKTARKNRTYDFRLGRVEEVLMWDDSTVMKYRPQSFVICKVDCENFDSRCTQANKKKHQLWYRYNRDNDNKMPPKEMNLFDKFMDSKGICFDKITDYYKRKI